MSTIDESLSTTRNGELKENLASLESAIAMYGGKPGHLFSLLRTDNAFVRNVAMAMIRAESGFIETKTAKVLLKKFIFALEDWVTFWSVSFTEEEVRKEITFPWNDDILNSPCPFNKGKLIKNTHFAFLGLPCINNEPLTVLKWHALRPWSNRPRIWFSQLKPWCSGEHFAKDTTLELRWYLLLKNIIPDSTNKMPDEQEQMLPPEYEIPTTIAEVTKNFLVSYKANYRPNPSQWARCKDFTSQGFLSCVGRFKDDGFVVGYWNNFRRGHGNIGMGASRK